jgi:nitroimidazol reductase NimA-like FMN-containing flavoprotein (pyridoxamine 5'-phosphate oxidase superfamily)
MTEQEREAFLAAPHVGVLSVAHDGRPPLTAPTWYSYEPGGAITFFTGTAGRQARKTQLLRQAGVLSLCVQQEAFPYKYVTVEGTVVSIDHPPSREQMLAVVRRYLPEEQARAFVDGELAHPGPGLVLVTVRPDRWLSADFGGQAE